MSDTPDYLPDNYLEPLEDRIARKKAVQAERASKLQPLQAIFVNHFFEANMDLSLASQRSGLKVATTRKWVEEEGPVADLITIRLQEMASRSQVNVDLIVEGLLREATREPLDTEDKSVSHSARVSAWSHLAKYKGMFDKGNKGPGQKISVNIDVGGNATITGEKGG